MANQTSESKISLRFWLRAVVEAGVSRAAPEIKEKVRRSNLLSIYMFWAGWGYVTLYAFLGLYQLLPQTIIGTLMNILIPTLNHFGHSKTARGYQCFNFATAVAGAAFMLGSATGTTMLFAPALVVIFLNFDARERKAMMVVLALCTSIVLWTDFAIEKVQPTIHISESIIPAIRIVSRIATLILLFMELYVFVRSMEYSQRELKQAHATTNSILNSMRECFYFVDRDWKVVFANSETVEHLKRAGVDTTHLVGSNFFEFSELIRNQKYANELRAAMETGQSFMGEIYVDRNDRWWEVRAEPCETGLSIAYRDIDIRKKAESRLRESEALQNEIFDQAATGLNLSRDGKYIRVNREMCRILGYTEAEFLEMGFRDISFPDQAEKDEAIFRQVMSGVRDRFSVQKKYRHKLGHAVPVHVQGGVVRDEEGKSKVLILSVQDLTESRLSEQKLMHASKMASVGEIAGSIAHEINSPIAAIRLSAEQLEDPMLASAMSPEELTEIGQTITQTVDRVAMIIRKLKAFSKTAERDQVTALDLAQIVQDTFELTRERFKQRNIDLTLGSLANATVVGRPSEISQALVNILNNAFDAIDDANCQVRWVKIELDVENAKTRLSVTDSGPGIPDTVLARMNEPFFTTKSNKKAAGVGLKIASDTMAAHGGRVFLDQDSKLTKFVLEFESTSAAVQIEAV